MVVLEDQNEEDTLGFDFILRFIISKTLSF